MGSFPFRFKLNLKEERTRELTGAHRLVLSAVLSSSRLWPDKAGCLATTCALLLMVVAGDSSDEFRTILPVLDARLPVLCFFIFFRHFTYTIITHAPLRSLLLFCRDGLFSALI